MRIKIFSTEQTTMIFDSMKFSEGRNYKILNTLCCMCSEPWLLSIDKFSHGVCYYGNMGNRAWGPMAAKIVLTNTTYRDKTKNLKGMFKYVY